jgi:hypothetical protein
MIATSLYEGPLRWHQDSGGASCGLREGSHAEAPRGQRVGVGATRLRTGTIPRASRQPISHACLPASNSNRRSHATIGRSELPARNRLGPRSGSQAPAPSTGGRIVWGQAQTPERPSVRRVQSKSDDLALAYNALRVDRWASVGVNEPPSGHVHCRFRSSVPFKVRM